MSIMTTDKEKRDSGFDPDGVLPVTAADRGEGPVTRSPDPEFNLESSGGSGSRGGSGSAPVVEDPYALTDERRRAATVGSDARIAAWRRYAASLPALETAEDRQKRERRERSKKIIGAVTDGVRALSNLWFTTKYAPDMYDDEKGSMLEAANRHADKARKDREANRDAHLKAQLEIAQAEGERDKPLRGLEAELEKRRQAADKADQDRLRFEWDAALQLDKQAEQRGKARKATADADSAELEAENKPRSLELDNEYKRAGTRQRDASAAASRASATASRASATNSYASARAHDRSNPAQFSAWDENGNEHRFTDEKAAIAYAKQHGTYKETDESEKTTTEERRNSEDKRPKVTTSTKTKKGGYPAKPEKRASPTRRTKEKSSTK